MQRSALCRSRRELSNEYLLAKIGADTAENEPLEVWGKIIQYYSFVSLILTLCLLGPSQNGLTRLKLRAKQPHRSQPSTISDVSHPSLRDPKLDRSGLTSTFRHTSLAMSSPRGSVIIGTRTRQCGIGRRRLKS